MVELLRTKLFIPRTQGNLVPRPRLVEQLSSGLDKDLTLIAAPAGFGKTTLVVDWLKQINLQTAWLSLDEADNDPHRFLAYLAAALQQVDEEIGAPLRSALQSPQPPAIEKVLTALLNELAARTDPLILVLDDYHLLTEAGILGVMEFLLHHQPPQLHLVLITREDPDLPLARLRARDQLVEVRAMDLRFTQDETDAFLHGVMGLKLSTQEVAALEDRTEGWVVGLKLAALSIQKQEDLKSFIADFSGSHRHILDYLTDEVILQQPEGTRAFLLQTSILDRLCGPLCDALTGRNDSNSLLTHLEAATLIEQHAITMLYQGKVTMVVGWFDQMPEDILESAPMLCIDKAWALVLMQRSSRSGEVEQALRCADQALDRVNAAKELRNLVAGHTASVQAFLLRQSALVGETPNKVIALSQNAQQLLPEQEKGIRSVNSLNIGYAYLALADLPAAELAYKETLEDGLAGGNLYAALYGPINLVLIALLAGRLKEALNLCETYIEQFNKILGGLNFPPIGGLYVLKARILIEFNRLAEAEPVLMEGLDLIRWTGA